MTAVDSIEWISPDGSVRTEPATPSLLHENFAVAPGMRKGVQYQNRRNRHSQQYVSIQRSHVWCESALEAECLLLLAFEGELSQIATQPMLMHFADGTRHFPDFFARLTNGDQVVYDVKAADRVDEKVQAQFDNTARVCAAVGWQYRVLHEAHPVLVENLEFLRAARHPHYHPHTSTFARIQEVFDEPRTFDEGAVMVNLRHPYLARAHIRHLLWHRYVEADLTSPLNADTVLVTTRKGDRCPCEQ